MTLTALVATNAPNVAYGVPKFDLAGRLRKAREKTGLDQVEFSHVLGASRTSVEHWESGRRVPRTVYLRAWAAATGVPVEWLETGKAPVTDDEGNESRLSDLNRRPVLYNVETCPDYVPSWLVEAVSAR